MTHRMIKNVSTVGVECIKILETANYDMLTWYGRLATHTSKNGRSIFNTSPTTIWSLLASGLYPWNKV